MKKTVFIGFIISITINIYLLLLQLDLIGVKTKPSHLIFEPNGRVTINGLKKDGFNYDHTFNAYFKREDSLYIFYKLKEGTNNILTESDYFIRHLTDSVEVVNFINRNNGTILNEWQHLPNGNKLFFVKGNKSNSIFLCGINSYGFGVTFYLHQDK